MFNICLHLTLSNNKIYVFPSSNKVIYQGYENFALDEFIKNIVYKYINNKKIIKTSNQKIFVIV